MRNSISHLVFILATFFFISFLTNILGPIVPKIIEDFRLSLVLVALLPFSFFIAYGVGSFPAGELVERYGDKRVVVMGWFMAFVGSLCVVVLGTYAAAIAGLFLIGLGMAMLQVAINPLLRRVVGEGNFAFYSTLGQLFFGTASFLSPWCYSWLVQGIEAPDQQTPVLKLLRTLTADTYTWMSVYWVFALLSLTLLFATMVWRFPERSGQHGNEASMMSKQAARQLLRVPAVHFFFFAVFAYVGLEQGIANWVSQFLHQYHGFDPLVQGARTVSYFWGLMTIGTLAGLVLLRLFDSRHILVAFTGMALLCLTLGLFGSASISPYAFSAIGFFIAVMWPIVISLALNSVDRFPGTLSGILITGICGGAIIPFIIGALSEYVGLRYGMTFLYVTLGYLLLVGLRARPRFRNNTVKLFKPRF